MSDSLPKIRQVLTEIFAGGLSAVKPDVLWKLREILEAGGLQRSVALLEELAIQKDAAGRFKSFTKLLLAIRQLELALTPFPRLKTGGFVAVGSLRGFAVAPLAGDAKPLPEGRRPRVVGLHLIAERLDLAKAGVPELVFPLSHSFHREAVLEKLKTLSEDAREALGLQLLKVPNRLLRRAAVTLLTSLGARLTAMKALLPLLGEPAHLREVGHHFQLLGSKGVAALGSTVDSDSAQVREQAVRLLRLIGDERAEPPLKRFLNDSVPTVRTLAKIALASIGAVEPKFLQSAAADKNDALLRIYGMVEMVKAGVLPREKLLPEIGEGKWKQYKIAGPAIAELPEADQLVASHVETFRGGATREARRAAFELLQHLPEDRFRDLFDQAASDCDPDIARKALEILVRKEGFAALERHADVTIVLTRDYAAMTAAEKTFALDKIFPFVAEAGDCRFVPYLTGLVRERCFSGPTIEVTYSLRPALIQYGMPMEGALRELTQDPNPNISGAARDILTEIRGKAS